MPRVTPPSACRSLDDTEAHLAQIADDARRCVEERALVVPELWFVLRHSGRNGKRWRVVFESRSREEAEAFYCRILPTTAISYACTKLSFGGTDHAHRVRYSGLEPADVPFGIEGVAKAALDREVREARRAKRLKPRVGVVLPLERLRIEVGPDDVGTAEVAEQEAVAVEAAMAARP